jgi:hypothetical protein
MIGNNPLDNEKTYGEILPYKSDHAGASTDSPEAQPRGGELLLTDTVIQKAAETVRIWFYRNDFDSQQCARELLREFIGTIPAQTDFFWVIEQFEHGRSAGYWNGCSSRSFVNDIDAAIQFRRKEDAIPIHSSWHWKDTQVTQHGYINTRADLLRFTAVEAKWDKSGLKEACQRGLAMERTRQEFDLQLLLDMLLEIEQLEAAPRATGETEALVDEVQHRMDLVVERAVEWHEAGRESAEWFDKAEALSAAIDYREKIAAVIGRHCPTPVPAETDRLQVDLEAALASCDNLDTVVMVLSGELADARSETDAARAKAIAQCVARVRAMGQEWYGKAKARGAAFSDKGRLAEEIAAALESLTKGEGEDEQNRD